VLVLTFSGTSRDGHGQHQASAVLGKEAFTAAGDPKRFPEQLKWVAPWTPRRVVQSLYGLRFADPDARRLPINPGEYDPVLGPLLREIGAISRSMHRCQAEGTQQPRGDWPSYIVPVAGDAPQRDLMDGIDVTWNRLPGGKPIDELLAQTASGFDPARPDRILPLLAKARQLIAAINDPLAHTKLVEIDELIATCSGLWIDAQAERFEAIPGADLAITVGLLNRSEASVRVESLQLEGMWNASLTAPAGDLPRNRVERVKYAGKVPAGQPITQPYWLAAPGRANATVSRIRARSGSPKTRRSRRCGRACA